MSISINYHLNKSKRTKTAKSIAIIGRVTYSFTDTAGPQKRSFKFGTGYSVPVNSFKKGRVNSSISDASHINSKLVAFTKRAGELYRHFEDIKAFPTSASFKDKLLSSVIQVTEERNFEEDFNSYIQYHRDKGSSSSMIKNLSKTLSKLKDVATKKKHPLDYSTMNLEFYSKLIAYGKEFEIDKETKGLKKNTLGGYIKLTKTFLNYATANGWNKYQFYQHPQFKILTEQIPVVSCSESEIKVLSKLDLGSRPRLLLNLHFFLLGCETGLRYVDYAKIKKDKIKEVDGGYNLEIKTQKTGVDVVIPLSRLAMDILAKYNFNLPKPPSNQTLNYNLKEIFRIAEIDKDISSHDSRRSFATNQYKSGTPVQWIMKITGHTSEGQLYKYIGVDLAENADLVRGMHDKYKIDRKGLLNTNMKIA